jgi:hypothetical protein
MKTLILGLLLLAPKCDLASDLGAIGQTASLDQWNALGNGPVIRRLGREKCFCSLYLILCRYPNLEEHAAKAIYENLDTKDAIRFCELLPVGEPAWRMTTSALGKRSKDDVVPFFVKAIPTLGPTERAHFYELFGSRRWPELAELARNDLSNDGVLALRNQPISVNPPTIGSISRSYLYQLTKRE